MIGIFRTGKDTLSKVVNEAKYALPGKPKMRRGDTILLALKAGDIRDGKPPIRYQMDFVRAYPDRDGESERIWGRHWDWMIEGANCRPLDRPFNIRKFQVTDKNYARGGTVVYVEPDDEQEILKRGLIAT
jgi:5-methylcytosine-specific restriction protein A